ncbi:hypothetical protein B0T13DRAFT_207631 [Neurospora crassa]|nr:hypothetical protein B0T13DRAFT_207631 [Neurospora crassa]
MSTKFCVSARDLGALGIWREEEPLQLHVSRRPSTALSAFPSSTNTTRLAASSTALDYSEHLEGGPEVLPQSVSGVVAGKEQRFDVQPRVTKSAYSRRRSLPRAIKQGNKRKGLRKTAAKALECHGSQTTVEVDEEHTQPNQPDYTKVEDEDSSSIVCAINIRLNANTSSSNIEQSSRIEESPARNPSTSPTSSPPADPLSPMNNDNMTFSSSHSRHTSSKSTSQLNPASSSSSPTPRSPIPLLKSTSTTRISIPTIPPSDNKHEDKDNNDQEKEDQIDDKDDWHQIHEPEQRRRIQNRIAQRKFRAKARSLKDQAARDAQNRRYAGCAYTCPEVGNLPVEYDTREVEEGEGYDFEGEGGGGGKNGQEGRIPLGGERVLSGLPWGGLSMRFVVGRGHGYYHYQQTSKVSGGSGSGSGSRSGSGSGSGPSGTGTGSGTVTSLLSPTITGLGTPTTPVLTGTTGDGDVWPALLQQQQQQQQQHQQQHPRSATYYGQHASGSSAGSPLSPYGMMMSMGMDFMASSDMDMDVDYPMAAVPPESGSGSGSCGHGSSLGVGDGMDMTYYDSSPYYYGYGSGGGSGGGDTASGSGGSV